MNRVNSLATRLLSLESLCIAAFFHHSTDRFHPVTAAVSVSLLDLAAPMTLLCCEVMSVL